MPEPLSALRFCYYGGMMTLSTVILAAGQGTRMKSSLPKVLHQLLGKPMAWYALQAIQGLDSARTVLVVGYGADEVQKALGDQAEYVLQEPLLGTGHAVMQAEALLSGKTDLLLVFYADMPLLTSDTLARLVKKAQSHAGPLTLLTVTAGETRGFGRILRDSQGQVRGIVEEAQATTEQLNIHELNPGVYCFRTSWLWPALKRIHLSPKGEYYLTDLVGLAVADGFTIAAMSVDDPTEVIGINTRVHLAQAETLLRSRINEQWMLAGVTMIDPASTYIEPGVTLGQDTILWPGTYLHGHTSIGAHCVVGPNTIITDTRVGDHCTLLASVLEYAELEDHVEMGPYCHLRKGAHLSRGVHMGNFGEVKNSFLGPGTKMGHFSYMGDAQVGADVNIGAGTITCNFDGTQKFPTEIGEGAFIGSDTMLVAPVKIGAGAKTGAGAVVTKDIPAHSLAVGVPARVIKNLKEG
ncbi:MAG TPA: bifunctional UDP-N-acetylglucosamine diphosphorylase/glucosamine-1-phosphate N-acetyltransferase GlmU [Anaerolineales bacterium]|nr:bifunctional UDP-N-acetylglucosamine diphosphorylase/glucosamine-1-phosphate N-acetyltransferase GlmU [Anaerolineales bacterium]